jgi:hypothetical protein
MGLGVEEEEEEEKKRKKLLIIPQCSDHLAIRNRWFLVLDFFLFGDLHMVFGQNFT